MVIPNQGRGAASMRIEAVRRIMPKCWFNETKTEPGRDALGYYHEKKDEQRNVGLGPEHDWSSHGADAFGLMAIAYEGPAAPGHDEDDDDRQRTQKRGRAGLTGYESSLSRLWPAVMA